MVKKISKLLIFSVVIATISLVSANFVKAQEQCTYQRGGSSFIIETLPDENGKWPIESTCIANDLSEHTCFNFRYTFPEDSKISNVALMATEGIKTWIPSGECPDATCAGVLNSSMNSQVQKVFDIAEGDDTTGWLEGIPGTYVIRVTSDQSSWSDNVINIFADKPRTRSSVYQIKAGNAIDYCQPISALSGTEVNPGTTTLTAVQLNPEDPDSIVQVRFASDGTFIEFLDKDGNPVPSNPIEEIYCCEDTNASGSCDVEEEQQMTFITDGTTIKLGTATCYKYFAAGKWNQICY